MKRMAVWLCCGLLLAGCVGGGKRRQSQYDLGLYLQQQGKGDDALQAFQRSLALDPEDPTPREALAQAYFERGWRTQAVQEWEKALAQSSEDPSFYVGEGKPLRKQAWIGDGVEAHKRAAAGLVKCYLGLADEAFKAGRFDDAAKAAKRVTELDKDNAVAWPLLARSAKKLKDGEGAYAAWKRCAELAPKDADIAKELGFAAFGLQKLNEAEEAFRRYSALKPDDPKGYNNEGTVLALLDRFDESQASFDRALAIQKDMIPSLNGKATAYYYQKRYDEARKLWAHVLDLAPDDPTAKENIRTLVKIGVLMRHLLYPGSFDPPTLGHLDLIRRGHALFPQLTVAVLRNGGKSPLFTVEERVSMLKKLTKGLKGVQVDSFDGLLMDYLKKMRNPVVLRGLRVVSDFEYEFQMALMNRKLDPNFEVLYLMPDERYSYISSSLVREVARLGGPIENFVPLEVAKRTKEVMHAGRNGDA